MEKVAGNSNNLQNQKPERRRRLHELLIALIRKQEDIELIDVDDFNLDGKSNVFCKGEDPASWLERNRRILKKYQSLVRSAITLDALLDSEQYDLVSNNPFQKF